MRIEKVKIKDLISPDYNPREITNEEMEKLKKSIKEFDYVDPIIVNSYNNHIIGGNQRFEAMKQLGYDEIEVSMVNIPDPNREKALNLRLNKLSGEWDTGKLNDVIQELEINEFDISITGFNDYEIKEIELFNDFEFDDDIDQFNNEIPEETTNNESPEEKTEEENIIVCPHCGEEINLTEL